MIGHVCLDESRTGPRLGGTAAYAALLARRLGLRVGVVTSAAPDVDLSAALPEVAVRVVPSAATTRFQNAYREGERAQRLLARAAPLTLADVPAPWQRAAIVHLAPVAREIDLALAAALRPGARFLGATAQGWLRDWDGAGRVRSVPCGELGGYLESFDAVVVSEEDLEAEPAGPMPLVGPRRTVALTRGAEGVRLLQPTLVEDQPACPARPSDPTGAGDVFAAAWFVRLAAGETAVRAARYAACAAACTIEHPGLAGVPNARQIEERLSQWVP